MYLHILCVCICVYCITAHSNPQNIVSYNLHMYYTVALVTVWVWGLVKAVGMSHILGLGPRESCRYESQFGFGAS